MPDVGNPVYTTMVGSIQEVAQARGLRLLLHSTGADAEDELAMLRDLKHRFVDGLILASLHLTDAHADELRRAAAPVIVIGRPTSGHARGHGPRLLAQGRGGGRPAPARRRAAADRVRQRPAAHGARARRAGSATSTASAPAGSRATTR